MFCSLLGVVKTPNFILDNIRAGLLSHIVKIYIKTKLNCEKSTRFMIRYHPNSVYIVVNVYICTYVNVCITLLLCLKRGKKLG